MIPLPPGTAAAGRWSPPLLHFATAVAFFGVFAGALFWGHNHLLGFDFQARWVLGLAHLLTLGVLTMTMLGALGQLLPVVWLVPTQEVQRWMRPAWVLFTGSLLVFVGALWSGASWYGRPAIGLLLSLGIYLTAFVRSLRKVKNWDFVALHVAVALGYLILLAVMGTLLAWDQQRGLLFSDPAGALIAHVHLALVGWMSLLICGVSYRLIPMFALSHDEHKGPGRAAFVLINLGLLGLAWDGLWGGRRALPLWAILLALGYGAYAFQMKMIFRGRHRRLDPSLALTVTALLGGALWVLLGLGLAFHLLPNTTESRAAYLAAGLLGWGLPFVLGQLTKILPMLVWITSFHPAVRPAQTPAPSTQDLTRPALSWAMVSLWLPAVGGLTAGLLLERPRLLALGSGAFLAIALLFAFNAFGTLAYTWGRPWRPQ